MKNLFSNILDTGMAEFLEDILMYLRTVKEHFMLLKKVPVHLCQYTFYNKLKKSSLFHNRTIFLGFGITSEGMHISGSKV